VRGPARTAHNRHTSHVNVFVTLTRRSGGSNRLCAKTPSMQQLTIIWECSILGKACLQKPQRIFNGR